MNKLLFSCILVLLFHKLNAQRNRWHPDHSAYEHLSKGENKSAFRSENLTAVAVDSLRFKNNPNSIRWTIPANSGLARLTFDLGDRDLRDQSIYLVCSRNHSLNGISCYVNTASGGKYLIGEVVITNKKGFHLPVDDWHHSGNLLASTVPDPASVEDLKHVVSLTFEAENCGATSILWIDEIRTIQPRGPVAAINFNRYRDQADTTLTPYLLQRGIKANIDFIYSFAKNRLVEHSSEIPFQSIGLERIDTLVNQHGWSCSSHGSYYDRMPYLSPQSRQRLFRLDPFINYGFDAKWCFAIPQDMVTPAILQEIWDYGQYRSIRRQGQYIHNLPVTNPLNLGFFRPTSRLAGPNVRGNPLLLDEMKSFVDSCIRRKGLIILDFGTIVTSPSPVYTDVETTLMSDATGLVEYTDSLGIPFVTFEELFGDDTAYIPSLTASDDFFVLDSLKPQVLGVLENDAFASGATMQVYPVSQPLHGNVSIVGTSLVYIPPPTCFELDSFRYGVSDGQRSDTALVRIKRMKTEFSGERTYHCLPDSFRVEAQVTGGGSPYSYTWSSGDSSRSVKFKGGGKYLLTITDRTGCSTSDSIVLPLQGISPPVTFNSLQCGSGIPRCSVFCEAGTLHWYATPFSPFPIQYGGTTFNGSIVSTTTLFVGVDYGECQSIRVPVTATVEKPFVSIESLTDSIGCPGADYILRAKTGTGNLYQWKLDGTDIPGAVDARLVTNDHGYYTVEVMRQTDSCFNISSTKRIVEIDTAIITTTWGSVFCKDDRLLLNTTPSRFFDYTWYENGNMLHNSNHSSIWVDRDAAYSVEIHGPGSCRFLSAPVSVQSVLCSNDSALWLYPNPAHESLFIRWRFGLNAHTLHLLDMTGRTISFNPVDNEERLFSLDVSLLCPGAYTVVLEGNTERLSRLLIKQ